MVDDDVTLGEVSRSLVSLEQRINEQFTTVNKRLDTLQFVPRGEYELQINNIKDAIKEFEESKKWMVRTIVISFLFPLMIAFIVSLVVK